MRRRGRRLAAGERAVGLLQELGYTRVREYAGGTAAWMDRVREQAEKLG